MLAISGMNSGAPGELVVVEAQHGVGRHLNGLRRAARWQRAHAVGLGFGHLTLRLPGQSSLLDSRA